MCLYVGQFQIFFIPNCVCVLTKRRHKTHPTGFFFSATFVIPKGRDLLALGVPRESNFFFEYGHVTYQIDWDDQ